MPPLTGSPPGRRINRHADVAQLVERKLPKLEVAGSTPVVRFFGSVPEPKKRVGFDTRFELGSTTRIDGPASETRGTGPMTSTEHKNLEIGEVRWGPDGTPRVWRNITETKIPTSDRHRLGSSINSRSYGWTFPTSS